MGGNGLITKWPTCRFSIPDPHTIGYHFNEDTPVSADAQSGVYLRRFQSGDRTQVLRLLSFLPDLYPGGSVWLDSRLNDVVDGKARCTLALRGEIILGITIETPKGCQAVKLSTIFVHPRFRGIGIGKLLMQVCSEQWQRDSILHCHVTADHRVADSLEKVLRHFSFEKTAVVNDRYGEGRHEVVFSWHADKLKAPVQK
jgi:GNAT superfamily N-acetyltransferase